MKGPADLVCATCGVVFTHDFGERGGRAPKHCPEHRKKRGEPKDREGNEARRNARRNAKRAGERKGAIAADTREVYDLAASLSIHRDPEVAAAFVGIAARGEALDRLVREAKRTCAGVIKSDPEELYRRIVAAQHLACSAMIYHRDQISPRDMAHAMRALAQVGALSGAGKQTRFASVTLNVVGADVQPIALGPPNGDDEGEG